MSGTESELLALYAERGDAEAFRALIERHQNLVFSACRRILGNAADAEDATQKCFLQLALNAGTLRAPVAPWLHRVAVHVSLNALRGEKRRRAYEAQALSPTLQAAATWEGIRESVDEGIAELPDDLRLPIVLHYLEGRSQALVAEELRLTQSAVSKRLDRGIEALRKHLRKAGWVAPAAALATVLSANAVEAAPAAVTAALGKMAISGISAAATKTAAGAAAATAATGGIMKLSISAVVAAALITAVTAVQPALSQKPPAPAPATADQAKPAYKLQVNRCVGQEVSFKATGQMTTEMTMPGRNVKGSGTVNGEMRIMVASADLKTGITLMGVLGEMTINMKVTGPGPQGEQNVNPPSPIASVFRMDASGKPVKRVAGDKKLSMAAQLVIAQLGQSENLSMVRGLPSNPVAAGATWESSDDTPLPGSALPIPTKITSTLAEVKEVNGRLCALIKSTATGRKAKDPRPGLLSGAMDMQGETETLLDIERGALVQQKVNSTCTMEVMGGVTKVTTSMTMDFSEAKTLQPEVLAAETHVLRAYDAALDYVAAGDLDAAVKALEALKADPAADEWQEGLDHAIVLINQTKSMQPMLDKMDAGTPIEQLQQPTDEEEAFSEAKIAEDAQNWKLAVQKYQAVAENYPDGELTEKALAAAARLAEEKLNDKPAADAISKKLEALRTAKGR